MRFVEKNVIISGGARGIGAATANLFAKQGANVYVLDIQPLDAPEFDNIRFFMCDVSNYTSVSNCIEKILKQINKVDFLIANAGVHLVADLEESNLEQIDNLININIKGTLYLIKATILPAFEITSFLRKAFLC